jgi:hypothetical protein
MLETTRDLLLPFDRWILPVVEGGGDTASWEALVQRCQELQMPEISVWRYGLATPRVLTALRDTPAF